MKRCGHSNENYYVVLSCSIIVYNYAVQRGFNPRVS